MSKPTRVQSLVFAVTVLLGVVFALMPARGDQIHRFGFGGKNTMLVRGHANVKVEEKEHNISDQSFKSQPTSEHLKLTADIAPGDSAYIYYHYDTPPAPVSEALSAGVWVKATKPGVQLRARVVFPKEPDPARPESPLTMPIIGDTYQKTRQWQKLTLAEVPALVGKHLPVLQTKIGRAVNTSGAYIDRLVLNVYTGPGTADIWIDDLDIGPVRVPEDKTGTTATPVKRSGDTHGSRGRLAEYRLGELRVDGKPFFFRAIRYTGTPLYVLRQAGFDALWVPAEVPQEILEEANREGWLMVPSAPLTLTNGATYPTATKTTGTTQVDALAAYFRKFSGTDILFWDLGGGRTSATLAAVDQTKDALRKLDPKHPVGGDVWDSFQAYSTSLEVLGAHRWPLFTSLELERYRDWLEQRNALTSKHAVFWTWIQNHLPEWYLTNVLEQQSTDRFTDPIGPQPEQVRLLTYISVACGCRGLGFWSDRFLADSHFGRDRLQGMAILNSELEMLTPLLTAIQSRPQWLKTSDPNVKAAFLRTSRGAILLPIWFGPGGQYVPDQGAVGSLTITVPMIEDGADPWRITPAGIECLRNYTKKVPSGTEVTIPEFDLVTPVVFTNDQTQTGLIVWWQDYARKYGKIAARWALDLAAEEYEKTFAIHAKLTQLGVTVRDADKLFEQAVKFHEHARQYFAAELYDKAFAEAHRALRPLRVIMRDHWNQATATLDIPTASPYAVSYFSLPKHWELCREVQMSQPTESVLPGGAFEPAGVIPKSGITVDQIPGWSARFGTLDRVDVAAGVVPAYKLEDIIPPKKQEKVKKMFAPNRPISLPSDSYIPPAPELGRGVLKLEVRQRLEVGKDGQPIKQITYPLERTFLAVDSPAVRLPPGTLVRVSGWVKIPAPIKLAADGVLFYDDVGGEPLGVRLLETEGRWKQFHLYRRVPASGQISLTVALTGVGIAYFDNLLIEPLVQMAPTTGPRTPTPTSTRLAPPPQRVQPAGYRQRQ